MSMVEDPGTPPSDSAVGRAITRLREPVRLGEGPIHRAMSELAAPRPRWRPTLWIGLGLAAVLALMIVVPVSPGAGNSGRPVRFALRAPASQVMLIGDFNAWDRKATPLTFRSGIWSTTVALKPGRYRYAFVVNGSTLEADPSAPAALDEFGASTSAITVTR
jgi:hypothetical protein